MEQNFAAPQHIRFGDKVKEFLCNAANYFRGRTQTPKKPPEPPPENISAAL
ncbi:MAG: hypothetical protein R3C40_01020 [Parvularculaceae bacterium]